MKAIFALAMLTLLGNVQASTSAQIKMIDNHLYGRENIQSLDVISTRYNNEIVVSLYSSRGNHHITLSKCNIE